MADALLRDRKLLSPSLAERVDRACDRFEDDWRSGRRPRIEEFLDRMTEAERSVVLGELLRLELHYRAGEGESPDPAEYERRFPEQGALIGAAFAAEGRPASEASSRSGGAGSSEDPRRSSLARRNERGQAAHASRADAEIRPAR